MEAKVKIKTSAKATSVKDNKAVKQKPKSKTTLFREKYPEGIGQIVNMRAVLR